MEGYHRKYYEQSVLWHRDYLLIPAERQRIEEVIKVIPPDAYDVLDVGCGNGAFVNTLVKLSPSDRFGLKNTHAGTGFMHESFNKDDALKYSRKWFAWANTLFGELILKVYNENPDLLKRVTF